MDEIRTNVVDDDPAMSPETPEDVAVLYTWANVHGGKYRDFSASRREFRAQQRHRVVEAQRQAELEAARGLEEAAALELEEARRVETEAKASPADYVRGAEAEEARRQAEEHVEHERLAAQRHVETAEELMHAMQQAEQEMEDARLRAEEQSARYAEAAKQWRESQRNREQVPGTIEDPYYFAGPLAPTAFAPGRGVRSSMPQRVSSESRIAASYYRSRESGEHAVPLRHSDSDDVRRAVEDANRSLWRTHAVDHRLETPEDTIERDRADELERGNGRSAGASASFHEPQNGGYFDRMPLLGESRGGELGTTRNSAQSDLHIPPRVLQTRTRLDSGSSATVVPHTPPLTVAPLLLPQIPPPMTPPHMVEDAPTSAHLLESRRRRESATDLSTRTERRTRSAEAAALESIYFEDNTGGSVPVVEAPSSRDASPEWLLRNRSAEDVSRERQRADAREFSQATQQRLDAQKRAEEDRRAEYERSEEAHRAAEETLRAEAVQRADAERVQREQERLRIELERRKVAEEAIRVETQQREDEQRQAEQRRMADEQRRNDALRKLDQERYRKEQERLRAEELRRTEAATREERDAAKAAHADASTRDSQMVRAADGGVNLRPLSDRGPLLSSLPPLRDRPQGNGLPMLADLPSRTSVRTVAASMGTVAVKEDNPASQSRLVPEPALTAAAAPPAISEQLLRRAVDPSPAARTSAPADTLQQSRERVAARWFALKGLVGTEPVQEQQAAVQAKELTTPCLAIVSLSGGVGKTSLVATIGRALSSVGEKVLLADTTPHGLLPFYFGARELRPNVVRTFSPPPGSTDAPVYMANYETERLDHDEAKQQAFVEEMMRQARGVERILLDLNSIDAWLARSLTRYHSNILVPVAPDMNSVLTIQSVDRFFAGAVDHQGRPVAPYYVLNQFDASVPLHLDVREVLRQQLGGRLLPVMIRRSPAVSEALAEGMTVIDYAPDAPVTEDYKQLAEWVRSLAAPAIKGLRGMRWSER